MIQNVEEKNQWRNHAACRNFPPDIFFPGVGESSDLAMSICAECPVKYICLEENIEEFAGIYGGTSGRERRKLREEKQLNLHCAQCGKGFTRVKRNQFICSDECYVIRRRAQRAKSRKKTLVS